MIVEIKNLVARPAVNSDFCLKINGFGIREGEWVAIVGPSGCGKSTLVRLILGMTPVISGTIYLDPALRHSGNIGYVSQVNTLIPWLTAEDNILWPAMQIGAPVDRQVIRKTFGGLGLSGHEGKFPDQLSGGMLRRVMLARTLLCSRKLILLDEPLAGLDVFTRNDVLKFLAAERPRRTLTCIAVFHELQAAIQIADKIYYFHEDCAFEPEPFECKLDHGSPALDKRNEASLYELMKRPSRRLL
jgi:NitT/TauT family transport system ATP-binding protein